MIIQKPLKCRNANCGAMCSPADAEFWSINPEKCPNYKKVERQTGEWIEEKINDYSRKVYCSVCGKSAIMEYVSTGDVYSASGHGEIKKTRFCPNCGTDMRGAK